jgi:hypothetical protein
VRRGNPHTIKGKGFDAHPENINREGRPKKLPAIDKLLEKVLGGITDDDTEAEKILEKLKERAIGGDVRAAEIILDRAYGKAKQSIDHTTAGESFNVKPFKFRRSE